MTRSLVAVVDDDSVYAKFLRVFLSVRGYDSAAYSRGDALLEAIRKGAAPDVILLDVNMPGIGRHGDASMAESRAAATCRSSCCRARSARQRRSKPRSSAPPTMS